MTSLGGAIAVIIATRGRPALVTEIVGALDEQSRRPDHIFVVGCSDDDISLLPTGRPDLTAAVGRTGLTLQRNDGLRLASDVFGALAFFDDDFWPSRFWLENALALFDGDPSIAGLTGQVLADGISGPGLSLAEAQTIVAARDGEPSGPTRFDESFGPYGCNMVFRAKAMTGMAFDERLPLYGWLEDADFGARLKRRGRMGRADTLWGVHLARAAAAKRVCASATARSPTPTISCARAASTGASPPDARPAILRRTCCASPRRSFISTGGGACSAICWRWAIWRWAA